jgi:hypothetical protein
MAKGRNMGGREQKKPKKPSCITRFRPNLGLISMTEIHGTSLTLRSCSQEGFRRKGGLLCLPGLWWLAADQSSTSLAPTPVKASMS